MICAGEEYLYYFEDLAKKQVRIFGDACDYGYMLHGDDRTKAREAITELQKIYKNKVTKWGEWTENKPYGSSTTMFIPFEMDEGMHRGVELTVDFHSLPFHGKTVKFLSIEMLSKVQMDSGYKV